MRKKILTVSTLLGGALLIILAPKGCFNLVADGQEGASKSIGESKLRGVFVAEYYSPHEVQVINGSIKIHVKEAWLERGWYYKIFSFARPAEWYQLCMVVDDDDVRGYANGWTIGYSTGDGQGRLFVSQGVTVSRPATPYLVCTGKQFGDREEFDVVRWISPDTYNVEKLGTFVLLKKK